MNEDFDSTAGGFFAGLIVVYVLEESRSLRSDNTFCRQNETNLIHSVRGKTFHRAVTDVAMIVNF